MPPAGSFADGTGPPPGSSDPVSPNDRRLVRHLFIVVTIKVVVLGALWWVFVRDVRVPVDAERAADRLGMTPPAQGGHP